MGFIADLFTGSGKATKQATAAAQQAQQQNNALAERIFNQTQGTIAPYNQSGQQAMGTYNALIGLGTPEQQATASGQFDNYLKNFGFDQELSQGSRAITGNQAAKGLLGSGSTLKGLQRYGLGLRDQYRGNFLNLLGNQQALGLNAAGIGAGVGTNYTGQVSQNNNNYAQTVGNAALARSANNTNFLSGILGAGAAAFSDERLKADIERIGELEDGLGVYSYRYLWETARRIGVMAQEVARLRPWALGPVTAGFLTVDYGAL